MSLKSKVAEKLTIIYIKISHRMERNKLNMYISTLEREIQDIRLQIGIVCYDRWKNAVLRVEDIEELLKMADEKNREVEKQKELVRQLSEQEKRILGKTDPVVLPGVPFPPVPSISPASEVKDEKGTKAAESAGDTEHAGKVINGQPPSVLDLQRYHG